MLLRVLNPIEVIQRYQAGESGGEIAEELGVSVYKIYYILKKNNIQCRSNEIILNNNKVIELYLGGMSSGKIAISMGVSTPKILSILRKNIIKLRTDDSLGAKRAKGEISEKEYRELIARRRGFKSNNEYVNHCRYSKGTRRPMAEAKETPIYLGVYVAERVLSKVFENVQRMPNGNIGYDFICKKGYKIDVKCSCLRYKEGNVHWGFNIEKNHVADYFLLLAFNSRSDLEPQHVWLINNSEIVRGIEWRGKTRICQLKQIKILRIYDTPKHLIYFKPFEMINKLEQIRLCCNALRE